MVAGVSNKWRIIHVIWDKLVGKAALLHAVLDTVPVCLRRIHHRFVLVSCIKFVERDHKRQNLRLLGEILDKSGRWWITVWISRTHRDFLNHRNTPHITFIWLEKLKKLKTLMYNYHSFIFKLSVSLDRLICVISLLSLNVHYTVILCIVCSKWDVLEKSQINSCI